MSEVAAKSGMLVSAEKEVIGWVNKGDAYDSQEGDVLVTHFKTAEKMGMLSEFNAIKADNAPVKEVKEKAPKAPKEPKLDADGNPIPRTRVEVPKTGAYTVVKEATLTAGEECERTVIAKLLAENTTFENFWAAAPEKFTHVGRDGESKEFTTSGFVGYAIRRGMIEVQASA